MNGKTPPLPDQRISFRIDKEMHDRVAKKAAANGMQVATYVRFLVYREMQQDNQ